MRFIGLGIPEWWGRCDHTYSTYGIYILVYLVRTRTWCDYVIGYEYDMPVVV